VAILFSLIFGIVTISNLRNRLARLGDFIQHITSQLDFTPRIRVTPAMTNWAWWPTP
jgi:methyl-accepting chemotaxis protein